MTGNDEGGGSAAFWGRGALSRFDGQDSDMTLNGEVTTATLGTDYATGRWIAGLSVSHSEGDGGYRKDGRAGELDSSLTGFYPYASYDLTDRLSLWAVAGYGKGELTLSLPDGAEPIHTDIDMTMAASGGAAIWCPERKRRARRWRWRPMRCLRARPRTQQRIWRRRMPRRAGCASGWKAPMRLKGCGARPPTAMRRRTASCCGLPRAGRGVAAVLRDAGSPLASAPAARPRAGLAFPCSGELPQHLAADVGVGPAKAV